MSFPATPLVYTSFALSVWNGKFDQRPHSGRLGICSSRPSRPQQQRGRWREILDLEMDGKTISSNLHDDRRGFGFLRWCWKQ
jgi:hypothetical protein